MFNILLYTTELTTGAYILKCTLPATTQGDAIDIIKRPYSYMTIRTTKDYIEKLVVLDSYNDVIFGIDTNARVYYNNINSLQYKTLYTYCESVIRQLLRFNYHEDTNNLIAW